MLLEHKKNASICINLYMTAYNHKILYPQLFPLADIKIFFNARPHLFGEIFDFILISIGLKLELVHDIKNNHRLANRKPILR